MNPRIQRLELRFASSWPKARYLVAALVLEGSLVAMSFLISGAGSPSAHALSQGLQIESTRQKAVEAMQEVEEVQDPVPVEDLVRETPDLDLTRFHILDSPPLETERDAPLELKDFVPPELPPELWLRPILAPPEEELESLAKPPVTPKKETPSEASTAQVRLEPLEGQSPKPLYPARAVRLGLEGSVLFRIHVDHEGKVSKLEIEELACPQILLRAAKKALLQWRFQGGPGVYEKRIVFSLVDRKP